MGSLHGSVRLGMETRDAINTSFMYFNTKFAKSAKAPASTIHEWGIA